jgi:hypothetical protein
MLPGAEVVSAREIVIHPANWLKFMLCEINQLVPLVEQSKSCKQGLKDLKKVSMQGKGKSKLVGRWSL